MLSATVAILAAVGLTLGQNAAADSEPSTLTGISAEFSRDGDRTAQGLTVLGEQTLVGGSGAVGGSGTSNRAASSPVAAGAGAAAPPTPEQLDEQAELREWVRARCEAGVAQQVQGVSVRYCEAPSAPAGGVPADAAAPAPVPRPITVEDLVSFRPDPGELVSEPGGWAAVGTPSNFYATSEMHAQNGDLFGALVTVRWVPVRYIFDYGDGHSTRRPTATSLSDQERAPRSPLTFAPARVAYDCSSRSA